MLKTITISVDGNTYEVNADEYGNFMNKSRCKTMDDILNVTGKFINISNSKMI